MYVSGAAATPRSPRSPAGQSIRRGFGLTATGGPGIGKPTREPSPFPETPEGSVLGCELVAVARQELDKLPDKQRTVVTLRDMHGFDSKEVCELLDISIANQRVLLHRGRAAVRQALESYLTDES